MIKNYDFDLLICLLNKEESNLLDAEDFHDLSVLRNKIQTQPISDEEIKYLIKKHWKLSFEIVSNKNIKIENVLSILLFVNNFQREYSFFLCKKVMQRNDSKEIARALFNMESFLKPDFQNIFAEKIELNTG